jgi:hypothetical protein
MRMATTSITPRRRARRSAAHERRGDRIGIRAADRQPANPVAAALSANVRAAELSRTGVDSAVWLFSRQKITGSRWAAQRLIASCHSPSDDPPSPMKDTATRVWPYRPTPGPCRPWSDR